MRVKTMKITLKLGFGVIWFWGVIWFCPLPQRGGSLRVLVLGRVLVLFPTSKRWVPTGSRRRPRPGVWAKVDLEDPRGQKLREAVLVTRCDESHKTHERKATAIYAPKDLCSGPVPF